MLTIQGARTRYCDGVSRRQFLRIGALGVGAGVLTLPDILRAESQAGTSSPHKAVINVFLGGGPPHQDTWDIKTEAPSNIRGEFKPIDTKVPGIQICEVFHRTARIMDKCVIVRSIVGLQDDHSSHQCFTGWPRNSLTALGGRPSIGAAVSRLRGPVDASVPPFVGLCARTQHVPWSDPGSSGFLGKAYGAFKPDGPGMANMKLNGLSLNQLGDRKRLLTSFDNLRRDIDAVGELRGMDSYTERAFDVLTSSKLLEALDLTREDPKVRERYGDGKPYKYQYDGAPTANDQLLLARRLVEAGVRCVTLTSGAGIATDRTSTWSAIMAGSWTRRSPRWWTISINGAC
jgi:hypothetical protein